MPANSATGIYEFEEFRLDTVNHRLYSRAGGGPVELYPKAIELLVYLVRNNSRVISKEELLESLWRGAAVEDANLPQTVFVLRKALGESRSDPRFVLTYPKRGYRFIAPVRELDRSEIVDVQHRHRVERRGTINDEAYRAYVQGRFFWNKRTSVGLKKAVEHFEQAIENDPGFADAYEGLAESYQLLSEYYSSNVPKKVRGRDRRSEIDSQLADAHASLGYAQAFYDWDWGAADVSFKKALEVDPNNISALQWYGEYLCVMGRFEEALAVLDRAAEIRPDSPELMTIKAVLFYLRGDADMLVKQARSIVAADPDHAYGYFYLGFGYELKGQYRKAVDNFVKAAVKFGEPQECADELLDAFKRNGMDGLWAMRLEQYETRPHLRDYPAYLKSLVPARLGDADSSFAHLERAYQQRDRGIIYARFEPFLEPIRHDPRFGDLIRRIGFDG